MLKQQLTVLLKQLMLFVIFFGIFYSAGAYINHHNCMGDGTIVFSGTVRYFDEMKC